MKSYCTVVEIRRDYMCRALGLFLTHKQCVLQTEQMSSVETGQMSAVETRQMGLSQQQTCPREGERGSEGGVREGPREEGGRVQGESQELLLTNRFDLSPNMRSNIGVLT